MSLQEIITAILSEAWFLITSTKYLVQWIWVEPFFQVVLPTFAFLFIWAITSSIIHNILEKLNIDLGLVKVFFSIVIFIGLLLSYDHFNLSIYYYDITSDDIFDLILSMPIIRQIL